MKITLASFNRTLLTTLLASAILSLAYPLHADDPVDITITTSTTITAADNYAAVSVYDTPPAQTTINLDSATINHLFAYDSAIINSTNSTTNALFAIDNQATANITASNIDTLLASADATINITSGTVDLIEAFNNANITIDDVQNNYGLTMKGQSNLTINDGQFSAVAAEESATIYIRGGNIQGLLLGQFPGHQPTINITAGNITSYFTAVGEGTLNIFAHAINFDPNAGPYHGQLTGQWDSGSPFTINYFNSGQNAAQNVALHQLGDANNDNAVTLIDLDILGQNFGLTDTATLQQGDFNADKNVSLIDLDILGRYFGYNAPTPEPSSATLLLISSILILKRRNNSYKFIHKNSPLTKSANYQVRLD